MPWPKNGEPLLRQTIKYQNPFFIKGDLPLLGSGTTTVLGKYIDWHFSFYLGVDTAKPMASAELLVLDLDFLCKLYKFLDGSSSTVISGALSSIATMAA
ncbi:hypothetical protein AYI69_g9890 [Smittium culicis]|uniref:Uncharacterized protein n=1 Tax=Smittium culicis TaxID=133412 RepID=A0A1R1X9F6_9FUNG|nr:hypothetical protein AYI69_g9890 [Smittium culicis]